MPDDGWVAPGAGSTLCFLLIVSAVAGLFVLGVRRAGGASEPAGTTARWTSGAALGVALWMALTGLASYLMHPAQPAPLTMAFFVGCNATAAALAFSPVGARLARGLAPVWLVAPQALRLPLELVLHAWAEQGAMPVQMTFEGHNFDIVTGIAAVALGLYALRRSPSRGLVLAVNVLGLVLLTAVATIAVLSTPTPLRAYEGPPLLLAYHFPYGWIVPMCVAAALFAHLAAFRALRLDRRRSR